MPIITEPPVFERQVQNAKLYWSDSGNNKISIVHVWGTPYEMGFAQGRKWSGHKSAFRTSLSSTAADSSLTNIAATLDEWESDILEPLAKSGEAVGLHDLVGTMPITLMMRIFFGRKFVDQHLELISQLAKDAEFIMGTVIHNQPAATVLYKYFDTEANRYE